MHTAAGSRSPSPRFIGSTDIGNYKYLSEFIIQQDARFPVLNHAKPVCSPARPRIHPSKKNIVYANARTDRYFIQLFPPR
jgi:hypothetical protein